MLGISITPASALRDRRAMPRLRLMPASGGPPPPSGPRASGWSCRCGTGAPPAGTASGAGSLKPNAPQRAGSGWPALRSRHCWGPRRVIPTTPEIGRTPHEAGRHGEVLARRWPRRFPALDRLRDPKRSGTLGAVGGDGGGGLDACLLAVGVRRAVPPSTHIRPALVARKAGSLLRRTAAGTSPAWASPGDVDRAAGQTPLGSPGRVGGVGPLRTGPLR